MRNFPLTAHEILAMAERQRAMSTEIEGFAYRAEEGDGERLYRIAHEAWCMASALDAMALFYASPPPPLLMMMEAA